MDSYPNIADQGLIGDLQPAALVTTTGTVWLRNRVTQSSGGESGPLWIMYRYNPSVTRDGLRGSEGTFSLCTFWYVDALARAGRLDDAQLTFEKMHTYANHLGLFSEEISQTGEQLGNFPQAFSHLALIGAAINLNYQLDHGAGIVEPMLAAAR